jgi:hypothetical protein
MLAELYTPIHVGQFAYATASPTPVGLGVPHRANSALVTIAGGTVTTMDVSIETRMDDDSEWMVLAAFDESNFSDNQFIGQFVGIAKQFRVNITSVTGTGNYDVHVMFSEQAVDLSPFIPPAE